MNDDVSLIPTDVAMLSAIDRLADLNQRTGAIITSLRQAASIVEDAARNYAYVIQHNLWQAGYNSRREYDYYIERAVKGTIPISTWNLYARVVQFLDEIGVDPCQIGTSTARLNAVNAAAAALGYRRGRGVAEDRKPFIPQVINLLPIASAEADTAYPTPRPATLQLSAWAQENRESRGDGIQYVAEWEEDYLTIWMNRGDEHYSITLVSPPEWVQRDLEARLSLSYKGE